MDDLYDYVTPGGVPIPNDLPSKPTDVNFPYDSSPLGQWKKEWAEAHIPGAPFWVRSQVIRVSWRQTNDYLTLHFGRSPQTPPNGPVQGGEGLESN
jgi:hypothetical protein